MTDSERKPAVGFGHPDPTDRKDFFIALGLTVGLFLLLVLNVVRDLIAVSAG